MTRLSVKINKVALLRNARGGNTPNLLETAKDIEHYGAQGITVHPRPDERHIRFEDLQPLKETVSTEFNIEGYPSDFFLDQVCKIKPHQCTLVPDPPTALTSNTGWDTIKHQVFLSEVIHRLQSASIRVSIFLNPEPRLIQAAKRTNADRIELYTGDYAHNYLQDKKRAVAPYVQTAIEAHHAGLGINAGHDLNLDNLRYFYLSINNLAEVSIGHALITDSLYYGLASTVQMYLYRLRSTP